MVYMIVCAYASSWVGGDLEWQSLYRFWKYQSNLDIAARRLDNDGSGYIDAHELGGLLKQTVHQSDIDKMIADADSHGENDGKISKQEFIALVHKKT